jgi:hypothetical protein
MNSSTMKNTLIVTISLAVFSCQTKTDSQTQTPADTVATTEAVVPQKLCFLLTEGDKNQDSTKVSLTIDGTDVTGDMAWLPYEKDGAIGTIKGTKEGDIIKGTYSYTIEGSEQTEEVEFKLENDQLLKKEGELTEKVANSGNLIFKDSSKDVFKTILKKVDCQ